MKNKNNLVYIIIIVVLVIILGILWYMIINNTSGYSNNNMGGINNSGSVTYSSVKEITDDEDIDSGEFNSDSKDENVISVSGNVRASLSNITVNKTGD